MANVASALNSVKDKLDQFLPVETIYKACIEVGHHWRRRKFDPAVTFQLFVLQVLRLNTAITELRHLAKRPINAAAYCKARMRLPLQALQRLLEHSAATLSPSGLQERWLGLRVFLVDGSSTIAPDTPDLQKKFPQHTSQKKGCGFPTPKIIGLFDAFSGLITQVMFFSLYVHDLRGTVQLHPHLKKGDLLVGDRAFCSYGHFARLNARGVHGLFHAHASLIVSFRRNRKARKPGQRGKPNSIQVKRLGWEDQVVNWKRPAVCNRAKWMSAEEHKCMPETLQVRELRYRLKARGQRTRVVTIVTTLLDPLLYPKEKIAELYGLRWRVETHFAELKTTLKMRRIKCKTADGVQKEMLVFCLVYNLVHAVMMRAARRQHVEVDRVSFLDALRWVWSAVPGEELPDLLINPRRKNRHQPRVVKDRHDGYQRMTQPRSKMNRHPDRWPGRKKSRKGK